MSDVDAFPHPEPTAPALACVGIHLDLVMQVSISEHYEATGLEREKGPESVLGGPGINLTAIGI